MGGVLTPRPIALATAAVAALMLLAVAAAQRRRHAGLQRRPGAGGPGRHRPVRHHAARRRVGGAPRARRAGRARQPRAGAPAGAAQPPGDRRDDRRRAGGRPPGARARGQPGGAPAAGGQRHRADGAVPVAGRPGLGRTDGAGGRGPSTTAPGRVTDATSRCRSRPPATRTLRLRARFTRSRSAGARAPIDDAAPTTAGGAEQLCVLFLEDLRKRAGAHAAGKAGGDGPRLGRHRARDPQPAGGDRAGQRAAAGRRHRRRAAAAHRHGGRQRRTPEAHRRRRDGSRARGRTRASRRSSWAPRSDGSSPTGPAPIRWCWAPTAACMSSCLTKRLPAVFDADHLRRVLVNLLDNARRHASQAPGAIALVARATSAEQARLSRGQRRRADPAGRRAPTCSSLSSRRAAAAPAWACIFAANCASATARSIDYWQHPATARHRNEFVVTLRVAAVGAAPPNQTSLLP